MPKLSKGGIRRLAALSGVFVVAIATIFAAGAFWGFSGMTRRDDWPDRFQSNGERIYFTGTSASGLPITSRGGDGHMQMHMQMHDEACASCHGVDRQGGRLMPRFWMVAPPLTPAALFDDHSASQEEQVSEEHGHGDHKSYNDITLRRAISEGLDPAGKRLDPAMPRWSMADQDFGDLIEFLKTPPRDLR